MYKFKVITGAFTAARTRERAFSVSANQSSGTGTPVSVEVGVASARAGEPRSELVRLQTGCSIVAN